MTRYTPCCPVRKYLHNLFDICLLKLSGYIRDIWPPGDRALNVLSPYYYYKPDYFEKENLESFSKKTQKNLDSRKRFSNKLSRAVRPSRGEATTFAIADPII